MALFKHFRGGLTTLNEQALQNICANLCVDDGPFHIDFVDTDVNLQIKQIDLNNSKNAINAVIIDYNALFTILKVAR